MNDLLSIAPMIGWTDRHFRYLFRHIARCPTLYTEMIMDTAILYNTDKLEDFLGHDRDLEPPIALQLGGNNPETLGKAVEVCEQFGGFTEINLNCGCPSNKAKRCGFGAELMLEPNLVRQIVYEMKRKASTSEITVKCRIGTNSRDTWGNLLEFVNACREGGVRKMIIHARICILCGLSPAQNRNVPPLRYDIVSRLVDTYPDMKFVLNGGVRTFDEIDSLLGQRDQESAHNTINRAGASTVRAYGLEEKLSVPFTPATSSSYRPMPTSVFAGALAPPTQSFQESADQDRFHQLTFSAEQLQGLSCSAGVEGATHSSSYPTPSPVHGVMVGREAYNNPWAWAATDSYYYDQRDPVHTRREALDRYLAYAEGVLHSGAPRSSIPYLCKPLHNFFTGCRANKLYKRRLDHLLKVHVAHQEKGHRGHVVSYQYCEEGQGGQRAPSFEDLVREAAQEIPDAFLDSRAPEQRQGQRRRPSEEHADCAVGDIDC